MRGSFFRGLAGLAALISLSQAAWADPTVVAEIRDTIGDVHRVSIPYSATNSHFSFDVLVDANFDAVAAEMKIQSLDGNDLFQLTARSFNAGIGWTLPIPFDAPDDLAGSPGGNSSQLIGCITQTDLDEYVAAGQYRLMTVDALVLGGTPMGVYRLDLNSIVMGTRGYDEVSGSAGRAYEIEITAIPAPAALPLGFAGLGMVAWLRKRLLVG